MRDLTKEQLADLRAWRNDPRGEPFWEAVEDIGEKAARDMRAGARSGDQIKTAFHASRLDAVEDVMGLVGEIIEDNADKVRKESANA